MFEPGKCPNCGHAQHLGVYCSAGVGDFQPGIPCGCSPEKAIKADVGKPGGWRLLAWDVIPELLGIYQYGIRKGYLKDSWRNVAPERYEDALMRHMTAHLQGEERDPESGLRHIAHVAWNALAVMALTGPMKDVAK